MALNLNYTVTAPQKNEVLGNEPVDPTTGLSFKANVVTPGRFYTPQGGESMMDLEKYDQYVGAVVPELGEDYYNRIRAKEQSSIEQFGAFLNQGIVGEVIGGTLEGIGYLTDLKQYNDLMNGTEQQFGNLISNVGKNLRSWSEEATPIYTDPDQSKFAPGHWSWWMSQGKSVFSTLALMLPAFGAVKGLSAIGKAVGLTDGLLSLGKTLGVAPELMSWAGTGIARATVSRHMENLMEASQTRQEVLDEQLALGVDRDEAEEVASKAAANSYKYNWAMLLQDIPEYMILGNFASKATEKMSLKLAKELKLPLAGILAKKGKSVAFDIASEGGEEAYQYVVGEESRHLARTLNDPEYAKKSNLEDRVKQYTKNGEFWSNAWFGALGAGVTLGVAPILEKLSKGEKLSEEEQRIKNLHDWGSALSFWRNNFINSSEVENESYNERARIGLSATMGAKTASLGNVEAAKIFIDNIRDGIYNGDQLEEYGLTEEDANYIKENPALFDNFKNDLDNIAQKYDEYTNPKNVKIYSRNNAATLAADAFTVEKLKERKNIVDSKLIDLEGKIPNLINATTEAKNLIRSDANIESLEKTLKILKENLSKAKELNYTDEEILNNRNQINLVEAKLNEIKKHQEATSIEYSDELKNKDLKENAFDYNAVKDTNEYKSYVKTLLDQSFLDTELRAVEQEKMNNIRRINKETDDSPLGKENRLREINKNTTKNYNTLLDLSLNKFDANTQAEIKSLLDKGVNPISLVSGHFFGNNINPDLLDKIRKTLLEDPATKNMIGSLERDYYLNVFYELTGQRFKDAKTKPEFPELSTQVKNYFITELSKNIKDSTIKEEASEIKRVAPDKVKQSDIDSVEHQVENAGSTEEITDNKLYTDLSDLNGNIIDFLNGIRIAKVVYKGTEGFLEKRKDEYYFNEEKLKEEDIHKSLFDLGIRPVKHSVYKIDFPTYNKIVIEGKTFTYPFADPFSIIEYDDKGKPIKVTLTKGKKLISFTNPIQVQEIATALELINGARDEALLSLYLPNYNAGVYVTDPTTDKKWYVYSKGDKWLIFDPIEKKFTNFKTVTNNVLKELYSVLDAAITADFKQFDKLQQDEFRATFKSVRRASDAEINNLPSNSETPSPKRITGDKTEAENSSEEERRSTESGLVSSVASRLAEEAVNNQPYQISTEIDIGLEPVSDNTAFSPTDQEEDPVGTVLDIISATPRQSNLFNYDKDEAGSADLADYMTNPENDLTGSKFIFFVEKPISKDILNIEDEESFKNELDTIEIWTTFVTKDGKKIKGYRVPYTGEKAHHLEVPQSEEDKKDDIAYYLREKLKIREWRKNIISILLQNKIPVSHKFQRNIGTTYTSSNVKYNVATLLGIPAKDIKLASSRKDGSIIDVDGRTLSGKSSSILGGNVFVPTNLTCNKQHTVLHLNPTKISNVHAEMLFEAFKQEALGKNSAGEIFNDNRVYSIIDNKKYKLNVGAVIGTLIYNGKENTQGEIDKPFTFIKQIWRQGNKLYYGDFNNQASDYRDKKEIPPGDIIDFNNYTIEDKNKFIEYISTFINYKISVEKSNIVIPNTYVIGNLKLEKGKTYGEVIIEQNLVTKNIKKQPKYNTLFYNPLIRIDIDNIEGEEPNLDEIAKEHEELQALQQAESKEELIKINEEQEATKPQKPFDVYSFFENVKAGDEILYQAFNENGELIEETIFGRVSFKDGALQINNVDTTLIDTVGSSFKLSDKNALDKIKLQLFDEYRKMNPKFVIGAVPDSNNRILRDSNKPPSAEDIVDFDMGIFYREVQGEVNEEDRINVSEEKKWLRDTLGKGVRLEITNKYIKIVSEGKLAQGAFTNDSIILYEGAEKGTIYHEAFHRVSLLYLKAKQRKAIYEEARSKYNMSKDATYKEIEERLAEEFRQYVLTGENKADETKSIGKFFRDLLETIIIYVTGKHRVRDLTVDNLFKAITDKKFKRVRPIRKNYIEQTGQIWLSDNSQFTAQEVDSIVSSMMFHLVNTHDIVFPEDINNLDISKVYAKYKEKYEELKKAYEYYTNLNRDLSEEENKQLDLTRDWSNYYHRIMDNWKPLREALDDKLESLNIKRINKEAFDDGEEYLAETEYDNTEEKHLTHYDKASYEYNAADNILANIKLFIATTPSQKKINSNTGLEEFNDFYTNWYKMMHDLWSYTSIYDMMNFMEEKANNGDLFYKVLYHGIKNKEGELVRKGLSNGPEELRTQFERSLRLHKYQYITLIDYSKTGYPDYRPYDTYIANQSTTIINNWVKSLPLSNAFNVIDGTVKKDRVLSPITQKDVLSVKMYSTISFGIKREFASNGNSLPNLNAYIKYIIKALSEIGIQVTEADFKLYLRNETTKRKNISLDKTFNEVIDEKGGFDEIFGTNGILDELATTGKISVKRTNEKVSLGTALRSKRSIQSLSKAVAENSINSNENVVLGPDNNMYYIFSQSNFVTDFIKKINNKNSGLLEELQSDIYNGHSLWLEQIKKGTNVEIKTFSSFRNTAYRDLDKESEFLSRLHFMLIGDYMPLPVLADKPIFHMLKGLKGIDFSTSFVNTDGIYEFPFSTTDSSNDIYKVVRGYIADETNRIQKAKLDIDNAEGDNNYLHLFKNYHFKLYEDLSDEQKTKLKELDPSRAKPGNKIFKIGDEYVGNATKYIHFPELNRTKGEITDNQIKAFLLRRVEDTLNEADELGIIKVTRFETGARKGEINGISNLLIDNTLVSDTRSKFNNNEKWGIYDIIANYTINTIVSNMESEKLFSKDVAYYKNIEDKTKRLAELIAPGESIRSVFNDGEFAGITTYKTITLYTPNYSSNIIDELRSVFKKQLRERGVSKKDIKLQANILLSSYNKINAPDGQVFITPQMHRSISVRLGEWTPKMQTAYDLLMSDKVLSIEEQQDLLNLVMQPLKLVHYGILNTYGLGVPVYDKMALATLFPRLVKGTKLEPLLKKAISDNIGMIKFDSAVKVGSNVPVNYFNNDHTVNLETLDNLNPIYQSFDNLRMQQVTDPKDTEKTLLATQVRKIIADKIGPMSKLLSSLSNKGLEQLIDKIGLDSNGNFNTQKLIEILRKQAVKSNMPTDVIDKLKIDPVTGDLELNIDSFHDRKWIESRIIALITKETVKPKVPGDAYIQVTAYGTDDDLKLIDEYGYTEVKVSINLYKHIIPKEIWDNGFEASRKWLFDNEENLSEDSINFGLEGVAYRIPTQSPNMVVPFRVVDVLPAYTGNTIVVPLEFTALTDSDFDVDKLFIYIYNYNNENNELRNIPFIDGDLGDFVSDDSKLAQLYFQNNLNKTKLTLEEYKKQHRNKTSVYELNSQKAVENRLLDEYISFLTDPANRLEVRAPLSQYVKDIKNVCNDIKTLEKSEDKFNFLSSLAPKYQHRTKDIFFTSKAGVGSFALNIVHHAMGSHAGLALRRYIGVGHKTTEGYTDLSQKYGLDTESIYNRLASFLSANVDAPKDPYIFYGNINKETWGVASLLVRSGYGLDSLYFLSQPILKRLARGQTYNELYPLYKSSLLMTLIQEGKDINIADDLVKSYSSNEDIFNKEQLRNNIDITKERGSDYYARQLAILSKYSSLSDSAFELGKAVQYSQVDTNKYGNSILDVIYFEHQLNDTLDNSELINFDKLIEDTFLDTYKKNSIDVIRKLFSKLTITGSNTFMELYSTILNEVLKGPIAKKDRKFIEKKIAKELFSAIISEYFSSKTGLNYDAEKVKRLFVGEDSLPIIINNIKNKKAVTSEDKRLQNNYLIKYLISRSSENDKNIFFLDTPSREDDKYLRDRLAQGWAELLESKDERTRKIARALVAYSFYTTGFHKSMNGFNTAIPLDYLLEVPEDLTNMGVTESYNTFIKTTLRNYNNLLVQDLDLMKIHRDFYLNNWSNDDIVVDVGSVLDQQKNFPVYKIKETDKATKYPLVFTTTSSLNKGKLQLNIGVNALGEPLFRPFVKTTIGNTVILYEYVGYNTVGEDIRPVYKVVNKKGYADKSAHYIKEYGLGDVSILDDNNFPIIPTEESIRTDLMLHTNSKGIAGYKTFEYVDPVYRIHYKDKIDTNNPGMLDKENIINTEEDLFVNDNTLAKLRLIPTGGENINYKTRKVNKEQLNVFDKAYDKLVELANNDNISLEDFKDTVEHLKICL
jgi:hypothetical protein